MPEKIKHTSCITVEPAKEQMTGVTGSFLINLLAENGVFLRSDCGGRGVCRKCKVEILLPSGGEPDVITACNYEVEKDLNIRIPESSMISAHVLKKAGVVFPFSFCQLQETQKRYPGLAVDLGTTTIAVYLCDTQTRKIVASIAVKNPQSLCGDDVMNRIGYIGRDNDKLSRMQQMAAGAISWAIRKLFKQSGLDPMALQRIVVVGNPTMIHIFSGISPYTIGIAPYSPAFYDSQNLEAKKLSLDLPCAQVYTLPQISGFIGGDILAAAIGTELESQPAGTLLIDLGTNGELMLKDNGRLYATSCATGPAFEGASLSCGIQAIPGAIDRVRISENGEHTYSTIATNGVSPEKPVGICGSGIISAAAAFLTSGIIDKTGLYAPADSVTALEAEGGTRFVLFREEIGDEISISQKDIRSLQLGKAALRSGIECLLASVGRARPESIIVAGAFGSHVDKHDLLTLGMIPDIDPEKIHIAGNSAGAGAIMALCDNTYMRQAENLAEQTEVIQLTEDSSFQETFISHLGF